MLSTETLVYHKYNGKAKEQQKVVGKKGQVETIKEPEAKGSEMEKQIRASAGEWQFKRKLFLDIDGQRTHSAPSSPTGNCSILDLTWDEEEAGSVKKIRKEGYFTQMREKQQGTEAFATKIRRIIKRLDEETRTISTFAAERNTKREIKEATKNIRSLVSQLVTQEATTLLQTLVSKMTVDEETREDSKQEELIQRIEKLEKR